MDEIVELEARGFRVIRQIEQLKVELQQIEARLFQVEMQHRGFSQQKDKPVGEQEEPTIIN